MRDTSGRFIKRHGSLHTAASRKKISEALKGKNTWSSGRKLTEEHRAKIKANNAKYWLGKERPEMIGNQFRVGRKPANSFPPGHKPHNLGNSGKESTAWKENKRSPLRQAIRQLFQYRNWRTAVFKRDNFTCSICKRNKEVSGKLEADHYPIAFATIIASFNTIEEAINCEQLWDIKNGRTLCKDCHATTDNFMWKARMK